MNAILKLREELEHAYGEYELAQYIDSTARMQSEQSYWSNRIAAIKAQIAEMEDE